MRFAILAIPIVASLLAGCTGQLSGMSAAPRAAASQSPAPQPTTQADAAAPPDADNQRFFLVVRLRMTSIEVPVGTASGSEEIWSYLDEEPIQSIHAAGLNRNGFRVGIGRHDTWPDVARILRRMTGRKLNESTMYALHGDPVAVELKRRQPAQTIFIFRDDRTLSGADYPEGDYLLAMACTMDEDDPQTVMISAVPQIRSTRQRSQIVGAPGHMRFIARPEIHTLVPLAFQLPVRSTDFIVIGPGIESRRSTSPGHHFLVREKEGMEFETLLVIMPEVFRDTMP